MHNYVFHFCLLCIVILDSCQKETSINDPIISSLSNESGFIGSRLIITGSNFIQGKNQIIVHFGNIVAIVDSVTSNQLFLRVPEKLPVGANAVFLSIQNRKSNSLTFNTSRSYKVITLAGNGDYGQRDGNGKEATFKQPSAITMDSKGNLFVTDNYVIRKIDANGNVTTYAGSNSFGHEDGGIGIAKFYQRIGGIVADSLGSLYVSDRKFIRKINSTGEVNTVCGANDNSVFSSILGICLVNNMLYVTDIGQIKKISLTGSVEVLTGDGSFNSIDGSITNAKVIPIAITSDISGNLIFTEFSFGHKIRIVTSSRVSTLQLQSMNFKFYGGVATDKEGNIFTVDGHSIVKLDILGKAEIIAGNEGGYQDGNNTDAKFFSPNGLYVDDSNNIYVCDSFNNRIRKISPIN